jgi:hypothetical protein
MLSKLVDSVISNNISTQMSSSKNTNASTADELSIFDSVSKNFISLGMAKEEVDKLLGVQEKKDFKNMYNYHGLEVFYRNDKVAGLIINASQNETGRFKTNKKIGLGSSNDDVIKAHGDSIEKNGDRYLTYFYEKKENSLVKVDELPKNTETSATENLYCFSYLLFENGKVSMILIGDYQYPINMK